MNYAEVRKQFNGKLNAREDSFELEKWVNAHWHEVEWFSDDHELDTAMAFGERIAAWQNAVDPDRRRRISRGEETLS